MTTNPMLEAVARAMANVPFSNGEQPYDELARAAIGALLNPNIKMLKAGRDAEMHEWDDDKTLASYQSILRAALGETE